MTTNPSRRAVATRFPWRCLTGTDRTALVLYVSVAIALGFADFRVRKFPDHVVTKYIPGVLDGSYGAPAIYRVFAPYLIEAFNRATGIQPLLGFLLVRLAFIYASLVTLHGYLRQWYSAAASVGGTLAVAALLPLTLTNSWAHPDSFPELFLFTLGCLLIARQRDLALFPVLAVATLNRETAVFLVLLWGACRLPEDRRMATVGRFAGYSATWAVVFVGLRWLRGLQHYRYWMLGDNLGVLTPLPAGFDPYTRIGGYLWLALLAVPAWLALRAVRMSDTPLFMKRSLPVAGLFLLFCFMISAIIETRIFLPLIPLLLPAAMKRLADSDIPSHVA